MQRLSTGHQRVAAYPTYMKTTSPTTEAAPGLRMTRLCTICGTPSAALGRMQRHEIVPTRFPTTMAMLPARKDWPKSVVASAPVTTVNTLMFAPAECEQVNAPSRAAGRAGSDRLCAVRSAPAAVGCVSRKAHRDGKSLASIHRRAVCPKKR